MRRAVPLIFAALLSGTVVLADCTGGFTGNYQGSKISLSLPVKIVAELIEGEPEVTLVLQHEISVSMDCDCKPCCRDPSFQYAAINFHTEIEAFGGTIIWSGCAFRIQPGKKKIDPNRTCTLSVSAYYERGNELPAIGMDISIIGLEQHSVKARFNVTTSCKCTSNPQCEDNAPPTLLPHPPIHLTYGQSTEFAVEAVDKDHRSNLTNFSSAEKAGYLTPKLLQQDVQPSYGTATFEISYFGAEKTFFTHTRVTIEDGCGELAGINIPVLIHYPPEIKDVKVIPECEGYYEVDFQVWDPELERSCQYFWDQDTGQLIEDWDKVSVEVGELEGVELIDSNIRFWGDRINCGFIPSRGYELPVFKVLLKAILGAGERSVTIIARDNYGLSTSRTIELPLATLKVSVEPAEVEVGVDEEISAEVTADTQPHWEITLRKISGPGKFGETDGKGSVKGTYTWTAEGYDPWRLVIFEATDQCGASSRAYLLIHVLQPPRVYPWHVSLKPGETKEAWIYVEDPDSPSLDFTFDAPAGIEAEAMGEEPVRDYEDFGRGGRYVRLSVWVARGWKKLH